jgi:putative peptide zinc metalloprotease protein
MPRSAQSPSRASSPNAPSSSPRSAWPFPFDPPDPPRPGDNQALAVNTDNNSSVLNLAISLLVLTNGDAVDEANEAYAFASCKACTTIAVAFQVILIVGYVDEITPQNAAVAVNNNCTTCTTAAFAYQIVASLPSAPGPDLLQRLATILEGLKALEAKKDSLTPDQIYQALEQAKSDVLDALAQAGATDTTTTAHGDGGQSGGQSAGQGQADAPVAPTDSAPDSAPATSPDSQTSPTETTAQPTTTTESTAPTCSTGTDSNTGSQCTSTQPTTTPEPTPAPAP